MHARDKKELLGNLENFAFLSKKIESHHSHVYKQESKLTIVLERKKKSKPQCFHKNMC